MPDLSLAGNFNRRVLVPRIFAPTWLAWRRQSGAAGGVEGLLTMILAIGFVLGNIAHLSGIRAERARSDYRQWCAQVSALIPHGSKVLLSVIPDPYFGLLNRPDLQLR